MTSTFAGEKMFFWINKANLRDLIAATGLAILLKNLMKYRRFCGPCHLQLEIWWMSSKNNRAPPLYYVKLCASFRSHQCIETAITVWKNSIRVKIGIFVPCELEIWRMTWKTIGHLFYTTSSFVHHFKPSVNSNSPEPHQALCIIPSPYVNSNWSYTLETVKLGFDLCDLDPWPLILTLCMGVFSVIGNHSWKFCDDTMMGT